MTHPKTAAEVVTMPANYLRQLLQQELLRGARLGIEAAAKCVNDFGARKQKEFGLTQHVQDLYRGRDAIRALDPATVVQEK